MYEVYKTRAIIFSKKKYLEKSKKVVVFSREFGFINIVAHGIFLEKSKNKSILQSGNLADIYMIKGKNK
jgi:recombinational DNA repair protein (RecF pathway)